MGLQEDSEARTSPEDFERTTAVHADRQSHVHGVQHLDEAQRVEDVGPRRSDEG